MFQAFLSGSTPDCQELVMETIDIYNNKSTESHYVTLVDIQNMDPCSFPNKTNPITGEGCKETFSNMGEIAKKMNWKTNDIWCKIYFSSLGVLGIYILYKIMVQMKLLPKT
jgi:hypothetical protein